MLCASPICQPPARHQRTPALHDVGNARCPEVFLSTIPGPIVLVGHSYGGAVITDAATNNPDVKALVYVNAFAPDAGETVLPLAGPDSALAVDPTSVFDFVPYPGAPAGDFDLYLKENVFLNAFASGVPTREAFALYATQRPLALTAGSEPSGEPAWKTIPSWYLLGTRDLIIPPSAQQFMAERAGSTIVKVNAGHLSLTVPGHPRRFVTRVPAPQPVADSRTDDPDPIHALRMTNERGLQREWVTGWIRPTRPLCTLPIGLWPVAASRHGVHSSARSKSLRPDQGPSWTAEHAEGADPSLDSHRRRSDAPGHDSQNAS